MHRQPRYFITVSGLRRSRIPVKTEAGKIETDYVISSMPITELITSLRPAPPEEVIAAARWLKYRDLVCVALMFDVPFCYRPDLDLCA